jgi:hypothetical protein
MNLSKKVLLLNHIKKFITEQYGEGQSTQDILDMLMNKKNNYNEKINSPDTFGVRKTYLTNYVLYLEKRFIDFEYFRKKENLSDFSDIEIFNLIDFRDKIIFKQTFEDSKN